MDRSTCKDDVLASFSRWNNSGIILFQFGICGIIFVVTLNNLAKNLETLAWTHTCLGCQQGKIHRHTRLPPQPIPISQQHFSHLQIDLVGPLHVQ
jgi:hypothetical protein